MDTETCWKLTFHEEERGAKGHEQVVLKDEYEVTLHVKLKVCVTPLPEVEVPNRHTGLCDKVAQERLKYPFEFAGQVSLRTLRSVAHTAETS
jgi:hypothetical protein